MKRVCVQQPACFSDNSCACTQSEPSFVAEFTPKAGLPDAKFTAAVAWRALQEPRHHIRTPSSALHTLWGRRSKKQLQGGKRKVSAYGGAMPYAHT